MQNLKNNFIQLFVNFIILVFLIVILSISQYIISQINYSSEQLPQKIEMQWREQSRRMLNVMRDKLLSDIELQKIDIKDKKQLTDWSNNYLTTMKNGNMSGSFMLQIANEEIIWNNSYYFNENNLLNNVLSQSMISEISKKNNIPNKSILKFQDIDNLKTKHPEIYKQLQKNTNNDNFDVIFKDILMGKDSDKSFNYQLQINGDILWVEWVAIPPGGLGFNNEPKYINNKINPKFDKLVIEMSVNENEIMSDYQKELDMLINVKKATYLISTLIVIITFLFAIYYTWKSKVSS